MRSSRKAGSGTVTFHAEKQEKNQSEKSTDGDSPEQPPDSTFLAECLLDFLSDHRRKLSPLLILTHDFPDADALASAYGLYYLAEQRFDIRARMVYGGVIGRTENRAMVSILKIPIRRLRRGELQRAKHVALVDTQPGFANNPWPARRKVDIVIDQHEPNRPVLASLSLIDTHCGATAVIVTRALLLSGLKIPARLATALAYGILSDTMDLYRAQRQDVVRTYLEILHRSDMKALAKIQNPPRSRSYFVTLARCIRNAMKCRGLIVSHLGPVQSPELVAQMADFLLTYDKAAWSFCTGRYKGRLHVSLRTSRTDVQAGEILRDVFGDRRLAGGHDQIAGGSLRVGMDTPQEKWQELEERLQRRLAARLRLPSKLEFWKPFKVSD